MKKETDNTPANIRTRDASPPLSVEIRIRDLGADALQASEREVAVVTAAQGWIVRLMVMVAVLVIAALYVGVRIGSGWVPADDGTLSQSALRVMQGQLPHRDFAEIYTGGLSVIHALAFRAFGVNLMSLRICVFLCFLIWLPAVYYILLRFTSPITAGALTLLAIAWSYPNYPAAMPSWYNLFLATFGAAALLRYLEVRTRRWLFVAGVCGGLSILVKVIGAYYIAGVLLFLAFLEQTESLDDEGSEGSRKRTNSQSNWPYRVFSGASLLLFMATMLMVLRTRLGLPELFHFVLPSAAIVSMILLGEAGIQTTTAQRFKTIFRTAIPVLAGIVSPIVLFLVPYARPGTVWKFVSGVSSSAISRSSDLGVVRPVGVENIMWALPLMGVLAAAMYWDKFQGNFVGAAVGLGAIVIVVRALYSFDFVVAVWRSVTVLTPIVVLVGAILVWMRRKHGGRSKLQRQQVVLLISLAAVCSLVQFPFAAPIYLSYSAPLTLLALVAIVSTCKIQPGTYALASVVGLYLTFGVVSLVPRYIYEVTWMVGSMQTMEESRAGGLQIEQAAFFDDLARFLRQHSPNGLLLAGNDCPELYFLSGLKNVTRDDTGIPPEEMLKAMQSGELNLVVINDAPFFPGRGCSPRSKPRSCADSRTVRVSAYSRYFGKSKEAPSLTELSGSASSIGSIRMYTLVNDQVSAGTLGDGTIKAALGHKRNRRVIASASVGVFQRLVQLGSTLMLMPLLLRVLGPAKFGIWGAAASLAWLSGLVDIGTGTALVTLVARSSALASVEQARRHIAGALSIGAMLTGFMFLAALAASIHGGTPNQAGPYLIAALGLAINIPLSAGNNVWMALQQGYVSGFWELVQTLLTTAGLFGAAALTGDVRVYVAVVYAAVVAANGGSLVHLFWRHPELRPQRLSLCCSAIREVAGQGALYFILSLMGGLSFLLDNVLALGLLGPEASARMTIAMRICVTALGALAVMSQPLWPAFAEAAGKADRNWILKALFLGSALLVGLTIAGSAMLLVYGERLLRWWLRTDLGIGRSLLLAISAWVLAQALVRVPSLLLNGLSILRYQMVVFSVATALALVLKFVLAPHLGAAGILWATTATVLLIVIPASVWRVWSWAMHPLPRVLKQPGNRGEEIIPHFLP